MRSDTLRKLVCIILIVLWILVVILAFINLNYGILFSALSSFVTILGFIFLSHHNGGKKEDAPDSTQKRKENLGELHNVLQLPDQFIPRSECFNQIKQAVLKPNKPAQSSVVGLIGEGAKVGVHGMGGVGKTILASALAHDLEVRRAFPDGIFWLTIGSQDNNDEKKIGEKIDQTTSSDQNIVYCQQQLAADLDFGHEPAFKNIKGGKAYLEHLLKNKACLIILDDVWEPSHADAFNVLGPNCRLVLTTRIGEVITDLGASTISIDRLTDEEAKDLLAKWSGQSPSEIPDIYSIIKECGSLPLALSMVAAMVRQRNDKAIAWSDVLKKLKNADLQGIIHHFVGYQYHNLLKAMKVSVDNLDAENAERYLDFAIFPEDHPIPEAVLITLWCKHGWRDDQARSFIEELVDRSLAQRDNRGRLYLHDLQRDYLRIVVSNQKSNITRHSALIDAYFVKCSSNGWPTGPNDGYYFQKIPWHLRQARREKELCDLVWNYSWYRAKVKHTDVYSLILDLAMFPTNLELSLVQHALYLSADIISRDYTQMNSHLYGRLFTTEGDHIQALVRQITEIRDQPWLRSTRSGLDPPGGPLLRLLKGHQDNIRAVAISKDGSRAISGSYDRTLRVWDPEMGKCTHILKGHVGLIMAVAISNDGNRAVSASNDCTLRVWDLGTGKCLHTLNGHKGTVPTVTMNENVNRVVSGSSDYTLRVWNLVTGKCLHTLEGHTSSILTVAMQDDGNLAVSGSHDKKIRVWNLDTGKCLHTLKGHDNSVRMVVINREGNLAVSGSYDRSLRVWDLRTGSCLHTFEGHTNSIQVVAMTTDETRIISASSDCTLRVWDLGTRKCLHTLEGHTGSIHTVAINQEGTLAVSGSHDKTVRVWDLISGKCLHTFEGHTGFIGAVAISANGTRAVSASDDQTLRVWDPGTGKVFPTYEGHTGAVLAVAMNEEYTRVFSGSDDHTLRIWDSETGTCLRTLDGHTDSVFSIVITKDGKRVVSASRDNTIRMWDLETGNCLDTIKAHVSTKAIAMDENGTRVVFGFDDSTLKIWNTKSLTFTHLRSLEGHTNSVLSIAISKDGRRVISGSRDNTIRVWDLETEKCLQTLKGHTGPIKHVAMNEDGTRVVSGSDDRSLRVWNPETGKCLQMLEGHSDTIFSVAITKDGSRAISCSRDDTVCVWDLSDGKCLHILKSHNGSIKQVAMNEDGTYAVSISDNCTLNIWDLWRGKLITSFIHESQIDSLTIANKNRIIVAGDKDGRTLIMHLENAD